MHRDRPLVASHQASVWKRSWVHGLVQTPPLLYLVLISLPLSGIWLLILPSLGMLIFEILYHDILIEPAGSLRKHRNARLLVTYLGVATAILLFATFTLWLVSRLFFSPEVL